MTWTKEKAEQFASSNIGESKIIFLDGTATLRKCGAIDYLVNHCGYKFGGTKPTKERK
jgi:hypothetical protein